MLAMELLILAASAFAFAAGFLTAAWWWGGRGAFHAGYLIGTRLQGQRSKRVVLVPASPPMRLPPPQVESITRSPYAPRPRPAAKPLPQPIERIVRWRHDADVSAPPPTTNPLALPRAPTIAATPVTSLLPSIPWGRSCASK